MVQYDARFSSSISPVQLQLQYVWKRSGIGGVLEGYNGWKMTDILMSRQFCPVTGNTI
ncbi:hypothetical protein [Gracilimonas mengyeensis]|uniref:Uncharacterized protein n=1 Tax=Gracilimonas mengyeensis TaxID=1302730 RepID=A0A521AKF4_9BACT|nr:hypothetical protein [Gracilimonas mengyeensis]SMO35275.1 hypothetical protein SAMN06265219_101205 [Gracilimonas mengyeensis]